MTTFRQHGVKACLCSSRSVISLLEKYELISSWAPFPCVIVMGCCRWINSIDFDFKAECINEIKLKYLPYNKVIVFILNYLFLKIENRFSYMPVFIYYHMKMLIFITIYKL